MFRLVDDFLNKTTMYRLILYVLMFDIGAGAVAAITGGIPYSLPQLFFSAVTLVLFSSLFNGLFARFIKAETNHESAIITALILALILSPATTLTELFVLIFASFIANASKYVLALNKKHLINPAALACLTLDLMGFGLVSWWIGSSVFLPVTLISGFFVVRKIRREGMVAVFVAVSLLAMGVFARLNNFDYYDIYSTMILSGPLVFFATVMFTEPLTTPPRNISQYVYSVIVGLLFGSSFQWGPVYSTPELALVAGNIFSFLLGAKTNYALKLISRKKLTRDIVELEFEPDKAIRFYPGQYLEWTMSHKPTDSRGNRRFFTIASSPTERNVKLIMRFDPVATSSFKRALLDTKLQTSIMVSQPMGDFVLPINKEDKLLFIAGGVGVTPFLSMTKYLLDTNQNRDIVLLYVVKTQDDLIYIDMLEQAEKAGVKTIPVLTETTKLRKNWKGLSGRLESEDLKLIVPDLQDRLIYISGPTGLVDSLKGILKEIGVSGNKIITDYFPGF